VRGWVDGGIVSEKVGYLAVDEVDVCAEVVKDAGEFDGDVSPAHDDHLFGALLQVQNVVAYDGVLRSLDGQLVCFGPCGYQNVLCLHPTPMNPLTAGGVSSIHAGGPPYRRDAD
jgi:hypothetical protein